MIQVELAKIIIDERNHDQAVVLREKGGQRQIPIVIGFVEASSIQMKISGTKELCAGLQGPLLPECEVMR